MIADRYVVERQLGQGGAGAVWLVRDRESGEGSRSSVCCASMRRPRLKQEFRALAGIAHPRRGKQRESREQGKAGT